MEALAGDFDAAQLGPSPGPGAEHSDFSDYKDEHDDFDAFYPARGLFDGARGIGTQERCPEAAVETFAGDFDATTSRRRHFWRPGRHRSPR